MSGMVIVAGPFGLRVGEATGLLTLIEAPDLSPPGAAGLCADLRPHGFDHLRPDLVPLALARREGQGLRLLALAMRVDAHRLHFWCPPGAAVMVDEADLAPRLAALFQRHHLALNNFECNLHPIAQPDQPLRCWRLAPAAVGADLLPALLDWAEGGHSGVMLWPGNELWHLAGTVTLMRQLAGPDLLAVQAGGRRKKPAFDSPLWTVERFAPDARGQMRRRAEESFATDLQGHDAAPEIAAAHLTGEGWRRLGHLHRTTDRLGLECLTAGTLIEMDLTRYHGTEGGLAIWLGLRATASRDPADPGAAALDRLAAALTAAFPGLCNGPPLTEEPLMTEISRLTHPAAEKEPA